MSPKPKKSRKVPEPVDEGYSATEDDGIPGCVGIASRLADELEEAALAPFPDLHIVMNFSSEETWRGGRVEVYKRIYAAAAWADRIADVCGPPIPLARNEAAYSRIAGWTISQLFAYRGDAPRSRYARDVLGEPPDTLRRKCGTGMLREMRKARLNDPLASELRDDDKMALLGWRAQIQEEVAHCYLPIRAQALSLVTWLRGRVDDITSAALPTIRLLPDTQASRSHEIEVSLAGRARMRQVTSAHLVFLSKLAEKGTARAYRKDIRGTTKAALEARVPELRGLIETVRGSSNAENQADYRVSGAFRQRIIPVSPPRRGRVTAQ